MKYMSFGGTKYLEYTNKYLFSTDSVGLLVYFYQVFLHTSFPKFVPDQSFWRVHIIQKDVLLAMYISIQKRLPMHGISISAMVGNSNLAFQSHSSSYALNALLEEEVK